MMNGIDSIAHQSGDRGSRPDDGVVAIFVDYYQIYSVLRW